MGARDEAASAGEASPRSRAAARPAAAIEAAKLFCCWCGGWRWDEEEEEEENDFDAR